MPGDQDARVAPHASNGPGLQQPGPRPPRQRPTRLQGCPHGPERRTPTARAGAKTRSQPCSGAGQRSRRICTAFLTFQVAQGCQAGGRAGSDARTAVGGRLVQFACSKSPSVCFPPLGHRQEVGPSAENAHEHQHETTTAGSVAGPHATSHKRRYKITSRKRRYKPTKRERRYKGISLDATSPVQPRRAGG